MYGLIQQLAPAIAQHQGRDRIDGVLLEEEHPETVLQLGKHRFTCRHDYTLTWSPNAAKSPWPMAAAIIVRTAEDEFLVAGTGVVITFEPVAGTTDRAGVLTVDEGAFEEGRWRPVRRLNGDQTHQGRHLRIPMSDYGIQKLELYTYE